jgi:ornithine cyclodeaminase/alanine dehydrogenase
MLVLSRADVESLLTMSDAITAVEEGFRMVTDGNVVMPQRVATEIAPHGGLHLSMPAFVGSDPGTLSIKIVSVYPDNPEQHDLPMIQGVLLLHDARNGRPLALMDAEHLTAMRTGAASGVATRHLARKDASIVALFGVGAQAGAQLAAVCAVRSIEQVFVVSKTGRNDLDFCLQVGNKLGVHMIPCRDPRMAVESADIICTATNSHQPIFNGNWIQDGAHINAVGAYTAQMRELDSNTIISSRIFVDRHEAARTEAGDILIPIAEGGITYDHVIGELGEVVSGTVVGRTCDTDITLFKSVGLAMQDAVTAQHIYALALSEGRGQNIRI